jgi:tRNA nucleotidyltransferase (CCA-adding enzyme)
MAPPRARLQRLYWQLPDEPATALRCAVALGERRGAALYLVGGGVRDLLLGAAHLDIDLVVEGEAIALAKAVAKELGAPVVAHPRFGTAAVRGEGFRLDFARARAERYERPGALPSVEPATLADDLARRDFTINAIALRLTGPDAGTLLDPFGGQDDLARRRLRALHDESFRDDATRALRALRYAGRLGFRLEARTARILRRDLAFLRMISGARLRHEFERIADDDRAGRIVRLARRLGVLRAVHPALAPGERALRAIDRLARVSPSHRSAVLFCLLLAEAKPSIAEAAIGRLALTGEQARAVRGLVALRRLERKLARVSLRRSEAVRLLEPYPPAAIEAFALVSERALAARRARRYLEDWRSVRPRLDGHDVAALGIPRGPQVGAALALLRDARLDGRVASREDEETLVRRTFAGRRSRVRTRHG